MLVQGFAIGNGLTDPLIQYKAYTDYALDMGIIKKSQYDRINKVLPVCETAIKLCGNLAFLICTYFCYVEGEPFLSFFILSQVGSYMGFVFQNMSVIKSGFISVVVLKLNICSVFSFSGTDGTISCVASYFVCNSIFSSIMAIAGDVNVIQPTNSPFFSYC